MADDRRDAIRAYKERKVVAGIYAVRCTATGENWVGKAPDLATIQNRVWFALRQGGHSHKGLQHAWKTHGAEAFAFEVVEELPEEEIGFVRDRLLKERLAHWAAARGAAALFG